MYIIKHRTRRRAVRIPHAIDDGYYVVSGSWKRGDGQLVGTVEEAAEIAMDVWREKLKLAPQAPTIWEMFPHWYRMEYYECGEGYAHPVTETCSGQCVLHG